jgi:hypothetical protein
MALAALAAPDAHATRAKSRKAAADRLVVLRAWRYNNSKAADMATLNLELSLIPVLKTTSRASANDDASKSFLSYW